MNAIKKGKRFELEVSKQISKTFNIDCKRTPQSGGMDFKGDIISLSGIASEFHWECKHQEKLNIWKALQQANNDKRDLKTPVVVFKKNNSLTYAVLPLDDFLNILKELDETRKDLAEVKRLEKGLRGE